MEQIDERLAHFGKVTNIDFAKFDLDKPLPDHVTTNGHQLNLEQFRKMANGRSIRETMASFNAVDLSIELVGTPDAVAARMGEVMQEVGGDGFLFSMPNVNRRTLAEIEDGLIPALQDRGLMRKSLRAQAVPRQSSRVLINPSRKAGSHHAQTPFSDALRPPHRPGPFGRRPRRALHPSGERASRLARGHVHPGQRSRAPARCASPPSAAPCRRRSSKRLLRAVREAFRHQGARLPGLRPDQGQGDGRDRQRRMGYGPAQPRLDHEPAEARRLLREDRLRHRRRRRRSRLSLRVRPGDAGVGAGAGLPHRRLQGRRAEGLGRLLGHQEVPRRPRHDRHQRRRLAGAGVRADGGRRADRQALSDRHRQGASRATTRSRRTSSSGGTPAPCRSSF